MAPPGYSMSTVTTYVGRELGVSGWRPIDQDRIDAFAKCTDDNQWIHVDVERAKREGPFGGTIAHGYLTLAMLAPLQQLGYAHISCRVRIGIRKRLRAYDAVRFGSLRQPEDTNRNGLVAWIIRGCPAR